MRRHSFLDSSLKIAGIRDILLTCKDEKPFVEVMRTSRIRYKPSLLRYIRWCIEKKLLQKENKLATYKQGRFRGISRKGKVSVYHITYDGKRLLEITS